MTRSDLFAAGLDVRALSSIDRERWSVRQRDVRGIEIGSVLASRVSGVRQSKA